MLSSELNVRFLMNQISVLRSLLRSIVLLAAATLLFGCATVPDPTMSREESLAATSRTYDVPKETVIAAAEKVLRLADGDDFKLTHNSDGFLATRGWTVYLVIAAAMGTDHWSVRVDEQNGKSRINIAIGTTSSAITPMATTTPGTWTASSLPAGSSPPRGRATYDLFFQRMDYLLGYRPTWTDCKTAYEEVKAKKTWGSPEELCNGFNINDEKPTGPLMNPR